MAMLVVKIPISSIPCIPIPSWGPPSLFRRPVWPWPFDPSADDGRLYEGKSVWRRTTMIRQEGGFEWVEEDDDDDVGV